MYRSLKGMPDILPSETARWQAAERSLRELLSCFAYTEIRTPCLEETALFARSIGASTDVVEKEMFSFRDKGGTSMTLRPEGTASVVRAYIEHHLGHGNDLLKVYYLGPMFRHERPQKGRLRQFHQLGVEAVGSAQPEIDAEVLVLAMAILKRFQCPDVRLNINSVGDEACRPAYREKLSSFLQRKADALCPDCVRRAVTNPMRVFDCKVDTCRAALEEAPLIADHLCSDCGSHFQAVQELLSAVGEEFTLDKRIVRGLDYYTRTAFEIDAGNLGAQSAVLAGGRYDGLAKDLGGPDTPAIGFAMGMERLLMCSDYTQPDTDRPRIEVVLLDSSHKSTALRLVTTLREKFISEGTHAVVDLNTTGKSLKAGLRRASKNGARFAVILGPDELGRREASVKDLCVGDGAVKQASVALNDLGGHLTRKLRNETL